MSGEGTVITEEIVIFLTDMFGKFQLRRAALSEYVYFLEGVIPPKVIKIVKNDGIDDLQNEYKCLRYLRGSGLAPKPGNLEKIAGTTLLVMECQPGQNLLNYLMKRRINQRNKTELVYSKLGSLLAMIHSQPRTAKNDIRTSSVERVQYELPKIAFVPYDLVSQSYEAISLILKFECDWVFTHGDFGVHNVLFSSNDKMCVVDWEFGEWNLALNDLANVYFTSHLHFEENPKERWKWFLTGYRTRCDFSFSPELLRSYCVYRIWYILLRLKGFPQKVIGEWIGRLRWALQHNYVCHS